MTDPRSDLDRAERIRQLQARRTAPKRRHPAAATRWLLAGLSMASFFTIAGAVAVADQTATGSPQPATPSTPAPAVAQVPSPTAAAPSASPRPVPATSAPAPAPHTTTRGS